MTIPISSSLRAEEYGLQDKQSWLITEGLGFNSLWNLFLMGATFPNKSIASILLTVIEPKEEKKPTMLSD